jgi:hypothetical protein
MADVPGITVPVTAEITEIVNADRSRPIGRTAVQVTVPAAIVGIGSWAARLAGIDLDPGAGVDLPPEVVTSFVTVLTVAMALAMNRKSSSSSSSEGG